MSLNAPIKTHHAAKSQSLESYLRQYHTAGTVRRYLCDINNYLKAVNQQKAPKAGFLDIMGYIGSLRDKYSHPETIKGKIFSIKKYYSWLCDSGKRKDHPCKDLRLRDKSNRDIQLQDLFKPEELELLVDRHDQDEKLRIKNKVIISLLINQGLTRNDMVMLSLSDINLDEGTIFIKKSSITNQRTLHLKPKQIMLFDKYIHQIRPMLMKTQTDSFILSVHGHAENGEGISYVLETSKHLFPNRRLNTKTVRQSVIANLLRQGEDLRAVQVFAGHRYPGSTQKYKQSGIEELIAGIQKFHPLLCNLGKVSNSLTKTTL